MIKNAPIQDLTLTRSGRFVQTWILWFQSIQKAFNGLQNDNGGIVPVAMFDIDAQNNTIYYSLDGLKLSFKDSLGAVHALY